MKPRLRPLPDAIKRRWATDYYLNIQLNQSLLQQQVPHTFIPRPPPNLQYDNHMPPNGHQSGYYRNERPTQSTGGKEKVNVKRKSKERKPNSTDPKDESEKLKPSVQPPPQFYHVDDNILKYVQSLSEEELRRAIQLRGKPGASTYKGDLQQELLNLMRYEKVYQSYYYPQSADKRRKIQSTETKDPKASSQYENVYNYTHHSGNYYGYQPQAQPNQLAEGFGGNFEFEEEEFEYLDPAPVGEENKNGCMKMVEGILQELKDRRYIGGKGNTKTALPRQVLELNSQCELLRGVNPTDLFVVSYVVSHNKINEKLRVLEKVGQAEFRRFIEKDNFSPLNAGRERWLSTFDNIVVKFSSHSSGPYLKLRFDLYRKGIDAVIYSVDSHSFKTITKKGIKKREKKKKTTKDPKGSKSV